MIHAFIGVLIAFLPSLVIIVLLAVLNKAKHGAWVERDGEMRCNKCGSMPLYLEGVKVLTPYCPWCGEGLK